MRIRASLLLLAAACGGSSPDVPAIESVAVSEREINVLYSSAGTFVYRITVSAFEVDEYGYFAGDSQELLDWLIRGSVRGAEPEILALADGHEFSLEWEEDLLKIRLVNTDGPISETWSVRILSEQDMIQHYTASYCEGCPSPILR
jgi:hypothetical protein